MSEVQRQPTTLPAAAGREQRIDEAAHQAMRDTR